MNTRPAQYWKKKKMYDFWYFCTFAPRLNISLKKNTLTFDLDLPVAVFKAMVFAKKNMFQPEVFFSRIYKLVNTGFLEKM